MEEHTITMRTKEDREAISFIQRLTLETWNVALQRIVFPGNIFIIPFDLFQTHLFHFFPLRELAA